MKTLAHRRQQIVGLILSSDFLCRPFRSGGGCLVGAAAVVEFCCFSRHFEDLLHGQVRCSCFAFTVIASASKYTAS
jgi:hypothetical protein